MASWWCFLLMHFRLVMSLHLNGFKEAIQGNIDSSSTYWSTSQWWCLIREAQGQEGNSLWEAVIYKDKEKLFLSFTWHKNKFNGTDISLLFISHHLIPCVYLTWHDHLTIQSKHLPILILKQNHTSPSYGDNGIADISQRKWIH